MGHVCVMQGAEPAGCGHSTTVYESGVVPGGGVSTTSAVVGPAALAAVMAGPLQWGHAAGRQGQVRGVLAGGLERPDAACRARTRPAAS